MQYWICNPFILVIHCAKHDKSTNMAPHEHKCVWTHALSGAYDFKSQIVTNTIRNFSVVGRVRHKKKVGLKYPYKSLKKKFPFQKNGLNYTKKHKECRPCKPHTINMHILHFIFFNSFLSLLNKFEQMRIFLFNFMVNPKLMCQVTFLHKDSLCLIISTSYLTRSSFYVQLSIQYQVAFPRSLIGS